QRHRRHLALHSFPTRRSSDLTWTNIPTAGGGEHDVFTTSSTTDSNDWALVPVTTTAVYAFRRNAAGNGVDGASYSAAANSWTPIDRKSTRLNSSHRTISYAVF